MNTWQFSQLKWALGIGSLMTFYGIVNMAVWILGTQLGYPVEYRVVVIAFILLTMPFALIIGYVASRRNKKKEAAAAAEAEGKDDKADDKTDDDASAQKLSKPTGNYDDIDKSGEEVVQFLKSSNLGEDGKEAIYSLPWYLVLGTPKSGKSSLVIGSKLNFQTLPSQRESEQKFIRPTRSIDWRVTSDAVFIDTAGRYQTEGVDQDEWAALLETVKKQRSKRPLDGCLLVINTEQILEARESEIEQMAKVLRSRLDEAIERTKIRFPVYMVFTNADSIEGFSDSFSTSKQEGKNLVWGSTIPLDKSDNAQSLFDNEYGLLQDAVMKRRLMRLSAPFAPVRQLRIFNFPLHFGSARRKIGAFVSTLFRPNPFSESPFLRGFYFTATPAARTNARGQNVQTVGNTYFTERFFRDVLLRDKDLVATFQQQKQRAPIFGWVLTILGTFLTLLVLTLAGVSLSNNKKLVDDASARGVAVLNIYKDDKGKNQNPLDKTPQAAQVEMDATNNLYESLTELDKYDRTSPPWYMRMGLYSGESIYKENLLPIYFNVVEQRFKAPMIRKVEEDLQKFAKTQPVANSKEITDKETENLNKHYDLLKAYLMLSEQYKDKANATQISNVLKDYWFDSSKLPKGLEDKADKQLTFWANQVDRERFPRINVNEDLVAQTRAKLKSFPAPNRFYKQKVTEISEKLDKEVGKMNVQDILNRNSADSVYLEGDYTVPSAFTIEGYKILKKELSESGDKLSEPDWVMGETSKDATSQTADVKKIEELYFAEYATRWIDFVKDVKVKSYSKDNPQFAKDSLNSLSSPNSPLKVLAKEIARNTNFSAKPAPAGWWDWLMSFFETKEDVSTGGNTEVERQFLPLSGFVGLEDKDKPPIESYESALARVANKFDDFSTSKINQVSQELAKDDDKNFGELKDSSDKVKAMLKGFDTNAGQALATLFQQPLDNLKELLGASGRQQIEKTWKEKTLAESQEIEKSYPFNNSGSDIDLKKLSDFLNPKSGSLSEFYNKNLKQYFDETNDGVKPKEDSQVKFSDEFVTYLNNAFRLQKALYGDGATPKFDYEFTLGQVNDAIVEVTIDGQKVTSDGTGSNKLTFPASSGETGVFMNFASTSGTTSTTVAPPSDTNANSAAPPVNTSNSSSSEPLKFPGTWGLFKFFDAGSPQKQESGEYNLTYSFGGKSVTAKVKPTGGDLFDRSLFTVVRAPENIFK